MSLADIVIGRLIFSVVGRRVCAIGNNRRAAYISGTPVRLTLVMVCDFSGLTARLASFLLDGSSRSTCLGMGDADVLQSIAAVVIGGTSILGGSG